MSAYTNILNNERPNPMPLSNEWKIKKEKLMEAARNDPRIAGVVDYGSTSDGRGDEWSDLDVALFIHDADFQEFELNWKQWAEQFGELLLAYIGGVGHPWAVYAAYPIPLRVDFVFYPVSAINEIIKWPKAPKSVESMVWYDATDGAISKAVSEIIGKSLAPANLQLTFEQVCGDLWYYFLRTYIRLLRGDHWAARHDFNFIIVGNLIALMRMETGAVERWLGSGASQGIEKILSPERLTQLESCIPGTGVSNFLQTMVSAAMITAEVSESVANKNNWDWPKTLAIWTINLLKSGQGIPTPLS
jgi:hypothetical protein